MVPCTYSPLSRNYRSGDAKLSKLCVRRPKFSAMSSRQPGSSSHRLMIPFALRARSAHKVLGVFVQPFAGWLLDVSLINMQMLHDSQNARALRVLFSITAARREMETKNTGKTVDFLRAALLEALSCNGQMTPSSMVVIEPLCLKGSLNAN